MMTGDEIKSLREARGWNQQKMADELGIDQATVSRIERGTEPSGPVKRLLEKMAAEPAPSAAQQENAA